MTGTNGHTNGNSNSYTNGHKNGHSNGHSNGHCNGTKNGDKLVTIPLEKWVDVMLMYKKNWPQNFVTFYTIENFMKWKSLPKETSGHFSDEEVQFYSLNGDWSDGTHLIIDSNNHVFFNTRNEDHSRLKRLLQIAPFKKDVFYFFIMNGELEPTVQEYMKENNLIDDGGNSAYLYYLDRKVAMDFDISAPPELTLSSLREEHAKYTNEKWVYRHPKSEEYLHKLIEKNFNVGLYDEKDNLVAWCLRNEYGLLGTLQVLESHKRKGLGLLLVKALSKINAEQGYSSGATMDVNNIASQKLFEKAGFKRIGNFRYIAPKPKLIN